jgi:hypothetical protein
MSKPTARLGRIGILWRGDEATRRSVSPETSRFKTVFAAVGAGRFKRQTARWRTLY